MLLFQPQQARSFLFHQQAGTASLESVAVPDWHRFSETAQREGVSAILFHNITNHHLKDLIPQDCCRKLSNQYNANLRRNLLIIGALREVLAALQEAGIPCIVLKGIALAECVYKNIALRGMNDVDILVRKVDLLNTDNHLSSLGYTSRDSSVTKVIHNPAGYLSSLEYRSNDPSPLNLHVHWHPVNTSVPGTMFAEKIDICRLWKNATMTNVADSQALMLSPEHLIIYLCEHAMRVGHSFDRMILVCDIFYTIKTFKNIIDWDFIIEESRQFNLSRFVYYGLSIVRHHTSLDIPNDSISKMRPLDISRGERYFLKLQFQNQRIRGTSYFIYLAMNKRILEKIRFITRTFFPPAQILLQRQYRKDSVFSKSLYLLRIMEILAHLKNFYK